MLDLFKKATQQLENDRLTLEEILQKALSEPAYRPEFYGHLLSDELFVITNEDITPGIKDHMLQENAMVNIASFPDGVIPVFTSPERIFDGGIIKEQVPYLKLNGRDLFELASGATFVLNPYSGFYKELAPDEIQEILDGSVSQDKLHTYTVTRETGVELRQPEKYPLEMADALKILFSGYPGVKAAYLALINIDGGNEGVHYIFGIDTDNYTEQLLNEAGVTAKQFLCKNEIADFTKIGENPGLTSYFLENTEPFYQR